MYPNISPPPNDVAAFIQFVKGSSVAIKCGIGADGSVKTNPAAPPPIAIETCLSASLDSLLGATSG